MLRSSKRLTYVIGIIGVAGLFACAQVQSASVQERDHSVDQALLSFGAIHPNCRVWTDWNRVCARRPGSATSECLSSIDSAPPSAPFCAAGPESNFDKMTAAELESANRFCVTFRDTVLYKSAGPSATYHVCVSHTQERPFSKMKLPPHFCRVLPAPSPPTTVDIDIGSRRIPTTPALNLPPC
jgi:hypothetical protein